MDPASRAHDRSEPGGGSVPLPQFAGLWAAATTLFLLLPQRVPHGMDTHYFIHWLETGQLDYARHPLYMKLAQLVHAALSPLHCMPYRSLLCLSALCSGLGVAAIAAAARRALPGAGGALLVGAAALAVPSLFYYATAAEIGGVSAGAAGLAWLACVRYCERPTPLRAAAVGVATGAAAGVHAFGHLLPPTLAVAAFLFVRPRRPLLVGAAVAGAVHAAVALLAAVVAGVGAEGQASDAWGHLVERWATLAPATTPTVFWREWLLPYAPWSLLGLLALFTARSRSWAIVALAGLLLHLPLTVLLVGSIAADEKGMYHLQLVLPLLLAVRLLWPGRAFAVALLAAAGTAVALAAPHWPQPGSPASVQGLAALRGEGNFLLVATTEERDAAHTQVRDLSVLELDRMLGFYLLAQQRGETVEQWFTAAMRQFVNEQMPALWTADVCARLQNMPPPFEGLWALVQRDYRVEPVQRDGFSGCWVRPR